MAGIDTLDRLRSLLRGQGVRTAYVKVLSRKQDNSKNQALRDAELGLGLMKAQTRPVKVIRKSAGQVPHDAPSNTGTIFDCTD